MADVGRIGASRDRGQLLLVAALGLAILFVTLALILNTAIYTENLATRSSDIGGGTDAVRYHDAARDGVGGTIDYINAHNNTSYTGLRENLTANIAAFSNHSARLFASGNRAVDTDLNTTRNGTRIARTVAGDFSDEPGTSTDWDVVEKANNTRAFTINVTATSSLEGAGTGDEFRIIFDGPSADWILNVTGGAPTVIGIANSSGTTTCTAPSNTPVINVTAGTIDSAECEGLTPTDALGTPYTVRIENGDNVTGTFDMIVDNNTLADSPGTHLVADGNGQPFAAHAVYSANVTVVYQTPRLYYNATLRVAPEEPDG